MPTPASIAISMQQIRDTLALFAIFPSDDQIARIRDFLAILLKWNRSVGLTAVTNPVEIVGRHFGESMYATKLLPVENCRLADVGTGAGFPGLALKIACPGIQLILIESNRKKCAFLSEAVRILGFPDVEIRSERFEQSRPESVQVNIITSRAVGEFKQLLPWSRRALIHRGHLVLWVGAEDSTRISRISGWTWQPPERIPDSQRRYILIGRPIAELPPRQ
jgi:16S rRNA (guanine527-N7)-methyltransferase